MDILKNLGIKEKNYGACSGPNKWSETENAGLLESYNPANEEIIASVFKCNQNDLNSVINDSAEAFIEWRKVPAPERGQLIRQLADALRDYKDSLGSLVSLEMGKIKQEGDGEVQEMIVGVISAFNFPVAVWSWNSFIAAICGNTVVWKPSSSTPLCAIAIQNICNEVLSLNQYPNIFSLVVGQGSTIGENMIKDNRVSLVSFTGSTKMGRHVSQIVSSRFGKTILELGGNNCIIVDDTADFDLVIPAIVFGSVGTAGQRCTSTRRVLVHKEIYDSISEKLVNAYKQIQIGNPLDDNVLMGPLINEKAVKEFSDAIKKIREFGGKIIFGGDVKDVTGYFVSPTIIKAENHWSIVQDETFAPILYLIPYSHLDEAIIMHNDVPQGLSSSMFTTNLKSAEKFLSATGSDCGIANINIGTSGAEIGGAFGGEKETGGGRESGSDSWKQYMRRQTNTINWSDDLPLAQGIKFNLKK